MYPRYWAAFGALLLSPSIGLCADINVEILENLAFQDWAGSRYQIEQSDGSILSEYVSQTNSGYLANATLMVVFVPRFECSPIIGVQLPAEIADANTPVELYIDQVAVEFPVLIDVVETQFIRYSFNADKSVQQVLRQGLDQGTRASLQWGDASADEQTNASDGQTTPNPAKSGTVHFSLLGSKMTNEKVEQHCLAHTPVPYKN